VVQGQDAAARAGRAPAVKGPVRHTRRLAASRKLAEGLQKAISNKLEKEQEGASSPKPRKPPSIRPCWLVIYPNADMITDRDAAVEQLPARGWADVSTHFDQVWIATETGVTRLEPRAPWR
jgi:hypothetical protein